MSADISKSMLWFYAGRWLGTPWVANSSVAGRGVSCHNLPRAILIDAGALPADFPVVIGNPNTTRHSTVSEIANFMDSRSEFVAVPLSDIKAGDVIGIRICRCIDHLGLALGENNFIHVLMHKHTDIDSMLTPPWQQRIEKAWRLL